MSTSDIDWMRKTAETAFIYLLLSLFLVLFGAVYEYFSHDVYSYFMLYAFVFPLAGGALPFFGMAFFRLPVPNRASRSLYHSGIATLISGSLLEGVLEIYGTANRLTSVYWILGSFFILAAILTACLFRKQINTEKWRK